MYSSLLLSAVLVAPGAPVPRDTAPGAPGPAPRVLALKADAGGAVRVIGNVPTKVTVTNTHFVIENVNVNGKPVQQQVQKQVEQDVVTTHYMNKALSEFDGKFATADGTPLTLEDATVRIKGGATVLASADGKPIAKSWLRAVDPDTIVMTAEGLSHVQPQWGGGPLPTTPAPRLALLGTDDAGKVVAPCTSHPISAGGQVYYEDVEFMGRAGLGRGRVIRNFDNGGGEYSYSTGAPSAAKVVLKPLADVKFDAYDLSGKLLSRTETFKRLAAGGMVLVAGDNRMPDDAYLKSFREDVLVLVGPELVLPVAPVDQTKKKDDKVRPAPVAPGLVPAVQPLVRPAVIKRAGPAVKLVAPVEKAEKVEEKPAEKKPDVEKK